MNFGVYLVNQTHFNSVLVKSSSLVLMQADLSRMNALYKEIFPVIGTCRLVSFVTPTFFYLGCNDPNFKTNLAGGNTIITPLAASWVIYSSTDTKGAYALSDKP